MGKKHKKHHKHDRFGTEGSERPLKLVLKVGGSADSGFTSKAIVVPPAAAESPIRNGSSVTAPLVQRDTAFRGDHFVPQSAPPSLSVQVREDDITKKKKKKKKKHRHADEGDFHPTLVPSYRPEEQEQLARLYHHHPPVIEVHRSMYAGGEHRHHHKHRKHHRHHHHHDRLERKQRFVDHVSAGSSLDGYELDEYYDTPMVSSGHGLKISFKRDLSMTKTFEPPTKKFSPATPPGFFIDPTIPARVTRSQDVPGFEERNRLDRVKDKELKKLLLRFLNALQRKDVHQFFALPVSDKIAPGYSTVIKYPMDFHRMRLKIDRAEYRSVDEFKDDLELICTNCTTYNASDTVYYKAAVKLLEYGIKLMKDSLTPSRRNMPPHLSASLQITQSSVAGLVGVPRPTDEDFIDVDNIDETSGASLLSERSKRYGLVDWMNCSSPDQEGIEDQVMEQTVKAARTVAGKLEEQCPNSKIGFLSTDVSGSTSLRILNPDRDKENVPVSVDLGSLVGLVRNGTSKLADAREETKDLVIPVSYLFYGPFTSFAPSYDSSRANLTKEESDLLLSSYTDATGVQFAHSLQKFVEVAGPAAKRVVDSILDSATDGKHSTVKAKQTEKQKEEDSKQKSSEQSNKVDVQEGTESSSKKGDMKSLQSLADEGIDVSFLDEDTSEMSVQSQLDENARRLIDLHEAQNQRLAKVYDSLESLSSQLPEQSELETTLAHQVAKELNRLSAQVRPGDVVPSEEIQQLLKQGMEVGKADEASTQSSANESMSLLQELGLDDDEDEEEGNHGSNDDIMQAEGILQPESLGLEKGASSRETNVNTDIEQSVKELDSEDFSIATLLDKFTGDNSDL